MSVFLYPYKPGSASARALALDLNIKRIKHGNSRYVAKPGRIVINWGSSHLPPNIMARPAQVLNNPGLVGAVTNKLAFFSTITEAGLAECLPPWTTDKEVVRDWLDSGKSVMARTKLSGHSGEGIVILEGVGREIVEAPLYTLYMPKKHEYRVHCFRKVVDDVTNIMSFDVQQKKRKTDVPDDQVDWKVRNLGGGFIYARENIAVPDVVEDVAHKIFHATGLDFGAVDIIYNEKDNKAYALEVNTAPGLSGTTLCKYVEMFDELLAG